MEEDARRVGQYSDGERIESASDLAGRLLTTVYMGTVNSSRETQERAESLAKQVQHFHGWSTSGVQPIANWGRLSACKILCGGAMSTNGKQSNDKVVNVVICA